MSKNLLLFVFVFFTFTSNLGWAEQSLFNVPSSEITAKNHLFFQEQLNIVDSEFQSNSVFCYGIGHGIEVGFNITSLSTVLNNGETLRSYAPLLMLEAQKAFYINDAFRIAVGALIGTNPLKGPAQWSIAHFSFVNLVYEWEDAGLVFYIGGYFSNRAYLGRRTTGNFMVGLEWKILPGTLHWVTDHINGHHDLGLTVTGPAWYITPTKVLSLGLQIPNENSQSPMGAVIEFTML